MGHLVQTGRPPEERLQKYSVKTAGETMPSAAAFAAAKHFSRTKAARSCPPPPFFRTPKQAPESRPSRAPQSGKKGTGSRPALHDFFSAPPKAVMPPSCPRAFPLRNSAFFLLKDARPGLRPSPGQKTLQSLTEREHPAAPRSLLPRRRYAVLPVPGTRRPELRRKRSEKVRLCAGSPGRRCRRLFPEETQLVFPKRPAPAGSHRSGALCRDAHEEKQAPQKSRMLPCRAGRPERVNRSFKQKKSHGKP